MSWSVKLSLQLGQLDLRVELSGSDRPLCIVGPNGSGKTTLLRALAGAHSPTEGELEWGGRVIFDHGVVELPPEERKVGYMPQGYGLFPHLRVVDNVAFGALATESDPNVRSQAALAALERVGCASLAERLPAALSGGERQRVALARALMIGPQILLLDEPMAALDAPVRRKMRALLAEHLTEHAVPALVVTHDARDVRALGAQVCVIEGGRVIQEGTLEELADSPGSEFVAEFVGAE